MGSHLIGEYLIERLRGLGARHVFGIPGDYVLGFYDLLQKRGLQTVNTCDEQGAGFAADAYARVRGLGVVCVTYCVGGLKIANTTAQAFAEKSPVVVISGAPGAHEWEKNPLLHHKVREFDTQKRVFEQLTVASTVLNDSQTALQEIDRVLHAALRYKKPVYIELPRDMVSVAGLANYKPSELHEKSDPISLRHSIDEAVEMINKAKRPAILADVELHRFGLQSELVKLMQKSNIPAATTIMGKSVIGENDPLYLGVYGGLMGREEVRRYIEQSDCLLMLGVFMTDIDQGIRTARLDPANCISATSEKLSIRYHHFDNVRFKDFLRALVKSPIQRRALAKIPHPPAMPPFKAAAKKKMTVKRLFQRLNSFLREDTIVISDVGDALFGAAELNIHQHTEFLGTAYYASMGFALPAAVGAQMADPARRPLVLVGDGAFLMTGLELATIARNNLNPIIIVLNNKGYGTERHIHDGPYNDVAPLNYHLLPGIVGKGIGFSVKTEDEFEQALEASEKHKDSFSLIEVHLEPLDRSPALHRLARSLADRL